jgi:cytochrome-b5 reductase
MAEYGKFRYENGPMSTHIHSLTPNQHLSFKGPIPKYEWTPNKHSHIGMVAGGTGITPMYQLIRTIFRNPEDKTKVTLVFGNLTEGDVLLRDELQAIENTYPQRFRIVYLLDNAPQNAAWAKQGRVTKELLKEVLPEPGTSENFKIFVCGPPGMYRAVSGTKTSPADQGDLSGILKELGYKKEDVFKF